jgi:hypothetical protein
MRMTRLVLLRKGGHRECGSGVIKWSMISESTRGAITASHFCIDWSVKSVYLSLIAAGFYNSAHRMDITDFLSRKNDMLPCEWSTLQSASAIFQDFPRSVE